MSALAKLHVARKQLGLDEDTYRDALERATGKRSAKDMSEREITVALDHFKAAGFRPAPARSRTTLAGKYAPVFRALWIGAWNLGIIRSREDAALIAFVRRQTGIDHVRFVRDAEDATKAIEALKAWMGREGGVDWKHTNLDPVHAQLHGYKIARAQFAKLGGAPLQYDRFWEAVAEISGHIPPDLFKESDWHPVMNAFGAKIRARSNSKKMKGNQS